MDGPIRATVTPFFVVEEQSQHINKRLTVPTLTMFNRYNMYYNYMWVLVTIRMLGDVYGKFGNPLCEATNRGEGGWGGVPLGNFTDRKRAGSVPTFLQQMFDRENIFTAGEGREGKYMFYDTSHWRWRKRRKKTLHILFYCT